MYPLKIRANSKKDFAIFKNCNNLFTLIHTSGLKRWEVSSWIVFLLLSNYQGWRWLPPTPVFFQRYFSSRFFPATLLSVIHFWCKNLEKSLLPRESAYEKFNCLGEGSYHPLWISAPIRERKEFSLATPMFSGSCYPMKSTEMLYDQTGSGKSEMVASKPEVPISQPIDIIGTHFQRQYLCFWGPAILLDNQ